MADEIRIVVAEAKYADAAAELTAEAFDGVSIDQACERVTGAPALRSWQDIKADVVRKEFTETPHWCFMALMGEKLVGYVTTVPDPKNGKGLIYNLAVDKSIRGQGLGRKLIDRAVESFREQGFIQARIETLDTNPVGQHLYPSCGFTEAIRQIHYAMKL